MNYKVGDFIITNRSAKPALVIRNDPGGLLVSIAEYMGDYLFVNANNIEMADLKSEEKLSIVANFGDWFYNQHTLLYQEIIIENLQD